MDQLIEEMTVLQIKLIGELARDVEHGATRKEAQDKIAKDMRTQCNVHTSGAWVRNFATEEPEVVARASYDRIWALRFVLG
jgi:hypothetical protein